MVYTLKADRPRLLYPHLSPREFEVACLIAAAWQNKEIAALIGISEATIKNYVTGIKVKTGCSNRVEIALRFTTYNNYGSGI